METTNINTTSGYFRRAILGPLGLNHENGLVFWLMIILGMIFSWALWQFGGDIPVVLSIMFITGVAVLSFLRIDYSLYLLIFLVLIFDQFGIPGFDPFTYRLDFFRNLKEISYIPFFESGMFNPIEIQLFFMLLSLLTVLMARQDFTFRDVPAKIPLFLFFATFLFSFLYGIQNGGDFMVALWEVRALCYFFILYLIVPQIIRDKKQIQILIWVFIAGITFKALQGIYRFVELGLTTGGRATLTNHEDPIFIITLLVLLLGLIVFKAKNKQYFWLMLLVIPLLLGFYVGLRRAAYASLIVSFATFIVFLPPLVRWKFLKGLVPFFVGLLLYSAAFWNYDGTLGRPLQMIKSGFETASMENDIENYYSNLYRDVENYNLAQTAVTSPIIGVGFGNKYDQSIPLANIRFPLRDYIPHNEILWIMVKMGAMGFIAFWLFFNTFVARGAQTFARLKDPYLKAVVLMISIAVISQMVVSYYDLQLTYYRNMIYLGCLLGLLSPISHLADQENIEQQEKDENENH